MAAPVGAWLGWRWGVAAVVVLSAAAAAAFILLAPASRGFRRTAADRRSPLARVVWANLRSPASRAEPDSTVAASSERARGSQGLDDVLRLRRLWVA